MNILEWKFVFCMKTFIIILSEVSPIEDYVVKNSILQNNNMERCDDELISKDC